MEVMTFNVDKDRRNLTDDTQNFDIDFSDSKYSWLAARQYENQMRQVQLNLQHGDGEPLDLTGANIVFEGLLPDGTHRVVDSKHSTVLDAVNGQARFDFPAQAFAIAGSYKQAFFRVYRNGMNVASLEFSLEVYADKVISGLIPADYITPFNDLYDSLATIIATADSDLKAKLQEWTDKLSTLFTDLNSQGIETSNMLVTLETKIKQDGLFTQSEMDGFLGSLSDFKSIGTNLVTKLNNEFTDRSVNVKWFGAKGDGSTDDLSAIMQAIETVEAGTTIMFPSGKYVVTGNITINKKVSLVGTKPTFKDNNLVNGTVINGGGIFFTEGSSGATADSMGVVVVKGFTNGFDIHGAISGIQIKNCLTIAQSHGYLIESYDGLVDGTQVINCEAYNGIHGFISKATRTTFQNCLVSGAPQWGFGIISDNIPGANKFGLAKDNKIINCRAVNSGAAFIQYRRNYFEDNPDSVPCDNNQFMGCSSTKCVYGITIGDELGDTGDGQYVTYPVTNTNVSDYNEIGGRVRIQYSESLIINGIHLQTKGEATQDTTHSNIGMTALGITGQPLGQYNDLHILDQSSTPSLGFGRVFRTSNTLTTEITGFKDAIFGETYTIVLWDNNTSIQASDSINLLTGPLVGYGASITFACQNGNYYEVSRSGAIDEGMQVPASTSSINPGMHRFIDVIQASGDQVSPIHISNPAAHNSDLTIFVRSSKDHITPAGFDETQFVVPSDLTFTDLGFGTGLMTNWQYMSAISKYVLVSFRLAKYA